MAQYIQEIYFIKVILLEDYLFLILVPLHQLSSPVDLDSKLFVASLFSLPFLSPVLMRNYQTGIPLSYFPALSVYPFTVCSFIFLKFILII